MHTTGQNQFETLFADAFDTFRVFENLTMKETGPNLPTAPKTIWQILDHLVVWQEHQLNRLQEIETEVEINEQLTWAEEEQCESQEELDIAVAKFHDQLNRLRQEIAHFDLNGTALLKKLKVVQDVSFHLSFHLGEIILMRRLAGNYPMPHQMKEFLS